MDGSDIMKREGQILTGVAEKIGSTLGTVAANAETMSKRLTTAATEAGKAYRASMRGTPARKRPAAKTRAKRATRRAKAAPRKARKSARRPRPRR